MELPVRKENRLKDFDYNQSGAYFVTICTNKRKNLFWSYVGAAIGRPQDVPLSLCGRITDQTIKDVSSHYHAITVDHYVIMPDHVHLLLQIHSDSNGRPLAAPTMATVINQLKGTVSKKVGFPVWQKGFYDHVIRNQADYNAIWEYIEDNPQKWAVTHGDRKDR
jgi:REP element-mobilizing transposase RayT